MGIKEGGEPCTFLKSFGHTWHSKNSYVHYNAILRLADERQRQMKVLTQA